MKKCLDCNKLLTGHGNPKRCRSCSQKGHEVSKETREKLRKLNLNKKRPQKDKDKIRATIKRKIKEGTWELPELKKENHPHWIEDRESMEYGGDFDNALKEQVRFRDKYKCKVCGCSQLENGKQLDVHHKDYDKKNNLLNNLISLCMSCHRKTNYNRDYWKEYFKKEVVWEEKLQ